jgi:hypothetical protein
MVQLQLLAGMRPGEVIIMRAIDLDMTGKVWLYRPGSDLLHGAHKTAWRGHRRIIAIGPKAQEIIRQYLKPDLQAYLFSPAEAMAVFHAERRKRRKTKVQPSQAKRTGKRKPKRRQGEMVGRAELKELRGCKGRIDRILRQLPIQVRSLIDSKAGPNGGYSLRLPPPKKEVHNYP